jgi:hypothetical protein
VGVGLCGFAAVMSGVEMVAVGGVRVVRRLVVCAGVVMFCRLFVMTCGVFVVLGRLSMVLCRFLRHQNLLSGHGYCTGSTRRGINGGLANL